MRFFLALALLVAGCSALSIDNSLSEDEFEALFGGHTDDEELEQQKAQALAAAEAEINAQNLAFEHGESEFFEELNADSDKPYDFFKSAKLGSIEPNDGSYGRGQWERALDDPLRVDARSEAFIKELLADRQTPPASYDSRTSGIISPVKSQGQCGSCVAFSTVAATETCFYKTNAGKNGHTDLAEETVVDCGYAGKYGNACGGAPTDGYLKLLKDKGGELPHEYSDPYRNTNPYLTCRNLPPLHWGAKVTDAIYSYTCDETTLKKFIMLAGAVVTNMNSSGPGFNNFGGGIYTNQCSGSGTDHAVTAVGWTQDPVDKQTVWIVKNSWGTGWGEGGFFRIKSGVCSFGKFCGYPTCTSIGSFGSVPAMPKAASCDLNGLNGLKGIDGKGYVITVNGKQTSVNCVKGVCTPTTATDNACITICGMFTCG